MKELCLALFLTMFLLGLWAIGMWKLSLGLGVFVGRRLITRNLRKATP